MIGGVAENRDELLNRKDAKCAKRLDFFVYNNSKTSRYYATPDWQITRFLKRRARCEVWEIPSLVSCSTRTHLLMLHVAFMFIPRKR
jgi:hypothetical protein